MEQNLEQSEPQLPQLPESKPENRVLAALKALGTAALGFGKAQLILFGVNFCVVTIGMLVTGLKWWSPLIAVGVSLLDLLPVIGSGIVFVPWAIVALLAKNPHMAVAVGGTYIAMVVLRMVLDPVITGKNIGLSPVVTLLASVGGMLLFGGVGAIIGPAIAAVANILFRVFFPKRAVKNSPRAKRTSAEHKKEDPPAA